MASVGSGTRCRRDTKRELRDRSSRRKSVAPPSEEPSVESAETRAFDPAIGHDELLAKEQILGNQSRARRRDRQDEIEQETEGEHGTGYPRTACSGVWATPGGAWTEAPHPRSAFSSEKSTSSRLRTEYLRPAGDAS